MLKKIGIIGALLVVSLLAYAATKPDTFRVQRTATIAAPPEKVFGLIQDLHQWAFWSPWEKMDPAMKKSYSGAPQGAGAALEWDGNTDVGTGRMEIVSTVPSSRVVIKLDFLKPFEAHNQAEFIVEGSESSTSVTWAMHGPQPFIMKVMDLVMGMDKMVGKDFETGLANLKQLAER
ncbi:MAG: SRPBCC family protein [Nitrospirota bacterium]|nr:SRPBCC family protein [Nitrospirota bacterium]